MGRLSQRMRAALAAITGVALAVGLAGCGEVREDAHDAVAVDTASPPEPAPPPTQPPTPAQFRTQPGSCDGTTSFIDDVFLDAATGHRYLALRLVNCSDRPLTLDDAPRLSLQTPKGRVVEPRMDLWDSRPPVLVKPGEHAFVGLEYLAADQRPRASAVILTVAGHDLAVTGELDLDIRTPITVYPWVTRGEELWGN